jgi:hypothetical protein
MHINLSIPECVLQRVISGCLFLAPSFQLREAVYVAPAAILLTAAAFLIT